MKVTYTGIRNELPPKIQQKLDAKFAKVSKLLDGRGEREAHVIVSQERHLYRAEVTVQFYDHKLVGLGSDGDLLNALTAALTKLDAQAVKAREKWREKHRRKDSPKRAAAESEAERPATANPRSAGRSGNPDAKRVFRVNGIHRNKPMTLDEALLEMSDNRNYLAYRDAEREGLSVLVRRRDGHFDLIES